MKKIFFCFLTVIALITFSRAELIAGIFAVSKTTGLPCVNIQEKEEQQESLLQQELQELGEKKEQKEQEKRPKQKLQSPTTVKVEDAVELGFQFGIGFFFSSVIFGFIGGLSYVTIAKQKR